jgi:hypothetical protein
VQAVRTVRSTESLRLLSNPVRDEIILEYRSKIPTRLHIEILDQFGSRRERFSVQSSNQIHLPATRLSTGMYLLKIQTIQGLVQTIRVLKY